MPPRSPSGRFLPAGSPLPEEPSRSVVVRKKNPEVRRPPGGRRSLTRSASPPRPRVAPARPPTVRPPARRPSRARRPGRRSTTNGDRTSPGGGANRRVRTSLLSASTWAHPYGAIPAPAPPLGFILFGSIRPLVPRRGLHACVAWPSIGTPRDFRDGVRAEAPEPPSGVRSRSRSRRKTRPSGKARVPCRCENSYRAVWDIHKRLSHGAEDLRATTAKHAGVLGPDVLLLPHRQWPPSCSCCSPAAALAAALTASPPPHARPPSARRSIAGSSPGCMRTFLRCTWSNLASSRARSRLEHSSSLRRPSSTSMRARAWRRLDWRIAAPSHSLLQRHRLSHCDEQRGGEGEASEQDWRPAHGDSAEGQSGWAGRRGCESSTQATWRPRPRTSRAPLARLGSRRAQVKRPEAKAAKGRGGQGCSRESRRASVRSVSFSFFRLRST